MGKVKRDTITLVMDMKTNYNFGGRIRELRIARGLSQERLALSANITPAYLGLVERGKRNATVLTVERLCDAMNVSLAEFFSAADCAAFVEDGVGVQILSQLNGLSREERALFLQLTKTVMQLHRHGAADAPPKK